MKSGKNLGNRAFLPILLFFLVFSTTSCYLFKPPRCKIAGCKVRMNHSHAGQEFRGSPWWRTNKNPKVGQRFHTETKVAD